MKQDQCDLLPRETYLKAIENSIGSTQYRSLMVREEESGEVRDILEDGNLSCAYFVSSVLLLFGMINKQRATVASLRRFVSEDDRWNEVEVETEVRPGDVVFYRERTFPDGEPHAHVGFVLSPTEAASTSYREKCVVKHSLEYHPIDSIWRYSWE